MGFGFFGASSGQNEGPSATVTQLEQQIQMMDMVFRMYLTSP